MLKMMTASSSWMAADVPFWYSLGVAVNREGQIVVSDLERSGLSWLSLDGAPRALLSWAAYGWYRWAPHCPPGVFGQIVIWPLKGGVGLNV